MAHLPSSAIFSPSVARQQLAAAKDWNYIDSWLSSKFNGKAPPPFERNNETLKALLALAVLNGTADEERDLLLRVEAKALDELKAEENNNPNVELLIAIENSLSPEGQASLESLATMSAALNQSLPNIESIGRALVGLQVTVYDLEQASDQITVLETYLDSELQHINAIIKELKSDVYQPAEDLTKRTMEYQRNAKALSARLPDLKDRVVLMSAGLGASSITIQEVKSEEQRFKGTMVTVKDLEAQAKCFHGLSQDMDLARLELESIRVDLQNLIQLRDSMFEGLVERESPKKTRR